MKPGPMANRAPAPAGRRGKRLFEHEQNRRRRHVAAGAQHLALVVEAALFEMQHLFEGGDDLGPPGWQTKRSTLSIGTSIRPSMPSRASPRRASAKGGMARLRTTPKPSGSTSQPMMSRVPGQVCRPRRRRSRSPARPSGARPRRLRRRRGRSRRRRRRSSLSGLTARVQTSTVTKSTVLPGQACARRAARIRPETPAAQPRPKSGTRATSERKRSRSRSCASRLGTAIPVEEAVTTMSTSAPVRPASSRARVAASA